MRFRRLNGGISEAPSSKPSNGFTKTRKTYGLSRNGRKDRNKTMGNWTMKGAAAILTATASLVTVSLLAGVVGREPDAQNPAETETALRGVGDNPTRIEAPIEFDDSVSYLLRVDALSFDSPETEPSETEIAPIIVPVLDPIVEKIVEPTGTYIPEIPLSEELQYAMQDACKEYDVPYSLALAVCETESSFRTDAKNGNCIGLMQINSINFEWLREAEIEPTTHDGNIESGVKMLGQLLDKYADAEKALMAYNCGETGAARLWARGQYKSSYSQKVIEKSDEWQKVIVGYFEGGNKNA